MVSFGVSSVLAGRVDSHVSEQVLDFKYDVEIDNSKRDDDFAQLDATLALILGNPKQLKAREENLDHTYG